MLRAEPAGCCRIALALGAQIRAEPLDRLRDVRGRGLKGRAGRLCLRNPFLDRDVKLVERAGGLGGLAEDVTAAEAGQIVGRVVKAKLMDSAVGADQFQVQLLQIRIHLAHGRTVRRVVLRAHLKTLLSQEKLQGGAQYNLPYL